MLRPTHVRQHINFLAARGHAMDDIVADTGIDTSQLSESGYLVTPQQCHALVANLIRLTGISGIGLQLGSSTSITDMGIVGYAMASSSTLGQAIGIWLQYGNAQVGVPFTLKLFEEADGSWGVTAASNGVRGSVYRFYVEEILSMGMSFGSMLVDQPFTLKSASFSYREPEHLDQYRKLFSCPMVFNASMTKVTVNAPKLSTVIKSNDSEMRELCLRHCSHVVRQISRQGPISGRLRDALTTMGGIPALEAAAEMMNMSSRTLRRHLQAEGTSFQRVLDEFRLDLARSYLQESTMPAKEVAYLLGFSDVDCFRRAFKTWTGQTIQDFRQAHSREMLSRQGGMATAA